MLYKQTVILNCDQDDKAYIVCYEKGTGVEKWRIDRPNRTRSYCTPTFFDVDGKEQMILSGSKSVTGYDPDTGSRPLDHRRPDRAIRREHGDDRRRRLHDRRLPRTSPSGIDPAGAGNITHSANILWHENKDLAR